MRILAASLVVAFGLSAGIALAAAPDDLADLPGQVAGVVGSGDQIRLELRQGESRRELAVGDDVRNGWILTGLTASEASLTRGGETRRVGLNPSGATAQAETLGEKTTVKVVGAVADLTPEETRRLADYRARLAGITAQALAAARASNTGARLGLNEALATMGPDADDFIALDLQSRMAQYNKVLALYNSLDDSRGAVSVYLPAGANLAQALDAAGLTGAPMRPGVYDASGGVTFTLDKPLEPQPMNSGTIVLADGQVVTGGEVKLLAPRRAAPAQ